MSHIGKSGIIIPSEITINITKYYISSPSCINDAPLGPLRGLASSVAPGPEAPPRADLSGQSREAAWGLEQNNGLSNHPGYVSIQIKAKRAGQEAEEQTLLYPDLFDLIVAPQASPVGGGATPSPSLRGGPTPARRGTGEGSSSSKTKVLYIKIRPCREGLNSTIKQNWGTLKSKLSQMITGLSKEGWTKSLSIAGAERGYKGEVLLTGAGRRPPTGGQGQELLLTLGFARPIKVKVPSNIFITCPSPTSIVGKSTSYEDLCQFLNKVKLLRPVDKDPYCKKGLAIVGS